MSAFISFAESNEVEIPQWTRQIRSGALALVVGIMLVYISATVFIPSDTYSTARWYDLLNVNQAIAGQVTWFNFLNPIAVSQEGAWFSVFTSVANLALAYQAAFGGHWIVNDKDSSLFSALRALRQGNASKINRIKLAYFLLLIGLTIFETATGMEFRQREETVIGMFKAAAVAFVVENAGSDWALTAGAGMVLSGFLQVWGAYAPAINDINRLRESLRGRDGGPSGKPRNNGGGNPGGGGDQQRQGNPQDQRRSAPQSHHGGRGEPAYQSQAPRAPQMNVAPPHASNRGQGQTPPMGRSRQVGEIIDIDPEGWPEEFGHTSRSMRG